MKIKHFGRFGTEMFNGVYNGKLVLVTGNTGFKGSWLTIWLKRLGAEVVGLSDSVPTEPSNFEICELRKKIKQYFIDVRNFGKVEKVVNTLQPDIIFHLAAQALVRKSFRNPLLTIQTNTQGTCNILEVLRRQKTPIPAVIITSDKCYRNVEWVKSIVPKSEKKFERIELAKNLPPSWKRIK